MGIFGTSYSFLIKWEGQDLENFPKDLITHENQLHDLEGVMCPL